MPAKFRKIPSLALVFAATITAGSSFAANDKTADASVQAWLDAQAQVTSWSADFVQTRYLKTLTQPLTATGHVWFAAPNKFRWEIGNPAQSIALRSTNSVLLLYPRLKRAEIYPLDAKQKGPWRDALALLETGFPRSREHLEKQFEITAKKASSGALQIDLRPKSASARRLMPQINITVDLEKQVLKSTELVFADGSRMRNDFSSQQRNPTIAPELFSPAVPEDFKIAEPLKGKR